MQLVERLKHSIATGAIKAGEQLPSVRRMAEDLVINPNTVVRAYRELEIRGVLTTHQGTGTFITPERVQPDEAERQRQLDQLVGDLLARAGATGFTAREVMQRLKEFMAEQPSRPK